MKHRWKLGIVFLPTLAGLGASLLTFRWVQPEIVFDLRIGLGVFFFAIGLAGSMLLGAASWGHWHRGRSAQAELLAVRRENQASRRRFLRSLDHELKNPLAGLQIELTNLRETKDAAERTAAEENAARAVARLTRLLADLRKLTDLETRPMERQPVDVPGVIAEMIEAACAVDRFSRRDIHLSVPRVPQPLPSVIGDRDLLGLLFYNLIENSLKFTGGEDEIEVRVSEDGAALRIEVADSGPGIQPGEEGQIFEELYRGTNAQRVEGSGLGLALARRIVDLHAGTISVRSRLESPRSTVFSVRLPVSKL